MFHGHRQILDSRMSKPHCKHISAMSEVLRCYWRYKSSGMLQCVTR